MWDLNIIIAMNERAYREGLERRKRQIQEIVRDHPELALALNEELKRIEGKLHAAVANGHAPGSSNG